MPTATDTSNVLEINALADAVEMAKDLQTPFVESDFATFQKNYGIRLDLAVKGLLKQDDAVKRNRFIKKLREAVDSGKELSLKQQRVALNILREHVCNLPPQIDEDSPEFDPEFSGRFSCYLCRLEGAESIFDHMHDLLSHKKEEHDWEPAFGTYEAAILDPVSIIPRMQQTGTDLANLRDGWYAFPHDSAPASQGGWLYFRVRRVLKDKRFRNRAFDYGKRIIGHEIVPAGTIEVQFLVSDTKELIGEQRPDGLYKGRYAAILEQIAATDQSQEVYATSYALVTERCSICNKALTDDISRNDRMGPDCVKNWKAGYYSHLSAQEIFATRQERMLKGLDIDEDAEDEDGN